jgi:hypothetical protein
MGGVALRAWSALRRRLPSPEPATDQHVLFCVTDHFEPVLHTAAGRERGRRRIRAWRTRYPALAARHWDSDGVPPQHTWFYPGEAYSAECLDALAALCRAGFGEIELHLHHGHDTSASLRQKLEEAIRSFNGHGALVTRDGRRTYGFIHGNMALDNSLGDPRFCGVDDELSVLLATGCYADFSMPTAPAPSQTRKVNRIFYAVDDPCAPKSYDDGTDAEVGVKDQPGLLLIPGPLTLDWRRRKLGVLPRIDGAEITGRRPGTADRVRRWVRAGVHVAGRPDWIVVKVSCHGAEESAFDALLGDGADRLHRTLEAWFRDRYRFHLHYVTARELYNIVKAAEAGGDGDPGEYRNFLIPPYRTRGH